MFNKLKILIKNLINKLPEQKEIKSEIYDYNSKDIEFAYKLFEKKPLNKRRNKEIDEEINCIVKDYVLNRKLACTLVGSSTRKWQYYPDSDKNAILFSTKIACVLNMLVEERDRRTTKRNWNRNKSRTKK